MRAVFPRLTCFAVCLAGVAACPQEERACRVDTECRDAEICAYGSCAVVACNVDEECAEHVCIDGICANPPNEGAPLEGDAPILANAPLCDVVGLDPPAGAPAVSLLSSVRVTFTDAETAAHSTVKLVDADGADVSTARLAEGAVVIASPERALAQASVYRVIVTRPCGADSFELTTTADVVTVDEAQHTLDVTWNIASAEVFPAAAATVLQFASPDPPRLRLSSDGGTLAFSDDGEQRSCEPTIGLTGDSPNPVYNLAGALEGDLVTRAGIRAVKIRGVATPAGVDLEGIVVADARMSGNRADQSCVPGSGSYPACAAFTCGIIASLGVECGACDDGEPYCVTFKMRALATPGPGLEEVTRDELCATTECADAPVCAQ